MEKYFRVDITPDTMVIDLFFNGEEHSYEIEDDFEDSWMDLCIEGEDKSVNVYIDDTNNSIKMTIYTEVDGMLTDDDIIECDDVMGKENLNKLLNMVKSDFTVELTVEKLEKMLQIAKASNNPINNLCHASLDNQDAPNCSAPDYYSINIKVSK